MMTIRMHEVSFNSLLWMILIMIVHSVLFIIFFVVCCRMKLSFSTCLGSTKAPVDLVLYVFLTYFVLLFNKDDLYIIIKRTKNESFS